MGLTESSQTEVTTTLRDTPARLEKEVRPHLDADEGYEGEFLSQKRPKSK
ncbi:hypothetical protein PMAA_085320 [Talaromyces marneffei ATCC 18224]|uniref:Uncharacterized protein n=1 Tax=Talaromyces marneffei (strain ATCC 18224 / CBS 334.59 / QM 7333) TaxID=441960 RepID=B6QGF0_TALMQ|nr:hypothetical protein PMAA_085320 [Talaromyces marneffei ATCC 18224]